MEPRRRNVLAPLALALTLGAPDRARIVFSGDRFLGHDLPHHARRRPGPQGDGRAFQRHRERELARPGRAAARLASRAPSDHVGLAKAGGCCLPLRERSEQ